MIETRPHITDDEKLRIAELWSAEYPRQLAFASVADFDAFLDAVAEHAHYVVADADGIIEGWLMAFTRDGERWFSIIVDGAAQGKGIGKALVAAALAEADTLNGWVIPTDDQFRADGRPYPSPLGFYEKLGFEVVEGEALVKDDLRCVKIRWTRNR